MSRLHELWQELKSSTGAPGLAMRLLHAGHDVRVFAAVSIPGGGVALVVELPIAHRPRDLARISTRTFEAVLSDFPGLPEGRCAISVVLHDPDYIDLFAVLGDEIISALQASSSPANASKAVVRCIERWRRFVEKNRRSLSEEEARGLIGELVVLSRASGRFGPHAAVQAWQGPTGSLRDFEFADFAVEVKTYQMETGAAVRISDPQQLESSPDRIAYLCVVRLARTTMGRSLPAFIALAEDILKTDMEALEVFRDRLASAGYLPSQVELYRDRYAAASPMLFQVLDGFPRIRPGQVPGSVRDVHFSILLAGTAPFAVDANQVIGSAATPETES